MDYNYLKIIKNNKRRRIKKRLTPITLILSLISGIFIACESSTDIAPESMGKTELNAVISNSSNGSSLATNKKVKNQGLATLRRATARYHDIEAAIEDGNATLSKGYYDNNYD